MPSRLSLCMQLAVDLPLPKTVGRINVESGISRHRLAPVTAIRVCNPTRCHGAALENRWGTAV